MTMAVTQGDPMLFADKAIGDGLGAATRLVLTFGLFFFDYDRPDGSIQEIKDVAADKLLVIAQQGSSEQDG